MRKKSNFSLVHKWRKVRKMINPKFSQNVLNTFVDVFSQKSEELLDDLRKLYTAKENILELVHVTAVKALYGEVIFQEVSEKNTKFIKKINSFRVYFGVWEKIFFSFREYFGGWQQRARHHQTSQSHFGKVSSLLKFLKQHFDIETPSEFTTSFIGEWFRLGVIRTLSSNSHL